MKILLFGATGHVGKEIGFLLSARGYSLTVVVRNTNQGQLFSNHKADIKVADVTKPHTLVGICSGYDVVISALGKSVSPNDNSNPSFYDVDYVGNNNVLKEAVKSKVKKFIYISALHAEKHLHLQYFKVHHEFSQLIINSGMAYAIIKPPAIFSGFLDMIDMDKTGRLINIGKGEKKTNPIYEGDLAAVVVDAIPLPSCEVEVGGKKIYTRRQLYEIIQQEVMPTKSIKNIPLWMFKMGLPLIRIFNKNMFDKFAFFTEVIQQDTIGPPIGEMTFEEYIKLNKNQQLKQ
jgi:uncharacterized protein YbjT (DUF2867 family)